MSELLQTLRWEDYFDGLDKELMLMLGRGLTNEKIADEFYFSDAHVIVKKRHALTKKIIQTPHFLEKKGRNLPIQFALRLSHEEGLVENIFGTDKIAYMPDLTESDHLIMQDVCDGVCQADANGRFPSGRGLDYMVKGVSLKLGTPNINATVVKYTAMKLAGKFE